MPAPENSRMRNLAQDRAAFAYKQVEDAKTHLGDNAKEFKSHVKEVPMMIRTNGMAAAYAFVFSKAKVEGGKNDYTLIQEISQKWLIHQGLLTDQPATQFYKTLTQLEREPYRRAVRELLALFTWLKRFADGLIQN